MSPLEPTADQPTAPQIHLREHLRELVDAFSDLISRHLALARVELKEDARGIAGQVVKIGAFVPLLLLGYGLLNLAAALFLRRYLALELGFLLVALLNLAVGGIGIATAMRSLKSRRVLDDTKVELRSTAIALKPEVPVTGGKEALT